ncbi:MAG: insulinase family protein, partial [Candidatus Eremiobacteraeota bacterium]|nr:insulinase family protein [Candidatus Eremiobacteraeota bacterium]
GRPILGNKRVVEKTSRKELLKFMQNYYTTDNLIISAAGNLSHNRLVSLSKKFFRHLPEKSRKTDRGTPEIKPRAKVKYHPCEQVYLCMGGKGITQTDKNKYKYFVLDSILGGSMSSRLFQEIREKRGLAYSVSSFLSSFHDCGVIGIYAGTNRQNVKEVITLIREILKDIRENGVSREELMRAKEHIKGTIYLALETTSNRMIRLVKSELFHGRLIPHEEIIEKIDKVTRKDVKKMAKLYLDPEALKPVILGPVRRRALKGII